MQRSQFSVQADQYARLAAKAETQRERTLYLSMESSWRAFADSDRRIAEVRQRNRTIFSRSSIVPAE